MRDIKHLANDLRIKMETAKETAKRRIADVALKLATENSPKLEPFLEDQGYAFINGEFYKKSGSKTVGTRRLAEFPTGNYQDDVTIVFKSMRHSPNGPDFDYAYYLGRINPGWLRFAETAAWIESGLNPEIASPIIAQAMREVWT